MTEKTKDKLHIDEKNPPNYQTMTIELGQNLFKKLFKRVMKMTVVFWMFTNGEELGFWSTKVPLESKEVEFKGRWYKIDRTAIQNRLGIPTINIDVHNAIGALRWIKPEKERDPQNTRDLFQRGVLVALWHSWKLPFILLIIMAIANVGLGMGLAIVFGSYSQANAQVESLRASNQDLRFQIELLQNATKTNNGGIIGGPIID